ncbi:MAG: hypothetical protein WAN36_06765 [Calditrichia bacterium]
MKFFAAALILLFVLLTVNAGAQNAVPEDTKIQVKYISAENVYLDQGKAAGLMLGDTLMVAGQNQTTVNIIVEHLSEYSASCRIIKGNSADLEPGMEVRRISERAVSRPPAQLSGDTTGEKSNIPARTIPVRQNRRTRSGYSDMRITGSISLQYYDWNDLSSANLDFSQPTMRFNIRGRRLWGRDYSFRIKTRTRHNQRVRRLNENAPENEWRNRIYEASFSYHDENAVVNYQLGRIISNKFSGVGYIDGGLLQYNLSTSSHMGIFAGTQPEWQYADFQTSIQKYGVYYNYQKGEYSGQRLESTVAAAGEYHGSTVSREFIYLQNNYNRGRRWSFYQSAELDINRGWRKERTGNQLSLTNLFVTGRYYPLEWIGLGLMYDNRKNYQTYETRTIADSLFDDALRQGLRGTLSLQLPNNLRIFSNFGMRKRETDRQYTWSYAGGLSKINLIIRGLSAFINGAGFSNFFTRGFNYSLRFNKDIGRYVDADFSAGGYQYDLKASGTGRNNRWVRLGGRLNLLRHFFFSGQYEWNDGDDLQGNRMLLEGGYRF